MRRLNFTGSTATGRRLAEAAGRQLKRVVLELGGYNPLIVLADADLEYAVNATAFGAFLHQGQICMSARRIIVERSIADEFIARLAEKTRGLKVGDPKEHDTIIGPVINGGALETVKARVERRRRTGREACSPAASAEGPCYQPTLLADVRPTPSSPTTRRSARSPRSRSWTPPRRRSSAPTQRPTGSRPGSSRRDTERGLALAQAIEAGIVHVNDQPVGDEPQMPFGGVKDSGFGPLRRARPWWTSSPRLRWITVQRGSHPSRSEAATARGRHDGEQIDHGRGGGRPGQDGRHGDGRRLRARRGSARPHRRARRPLRRDRSHDRLEQHRRARPRSREAAAAGPDPPGDLVVLHVEPRGSRGRQRRRDRGDARAAGDVRRGDPRRRCGHRRLLHAGRRRHAARRGEGGAHDRRRAPRARGADPRRRLARLRGARGHARQPLVPANGAQLQSADGHRRDGDDRRGGRGGRGGRRSSRSPS